MERCYIDLNGNLTTCCYDVSHRYGSLKEQTFEEIWNGPLYKKLRLKMREGKLPKWCGECQVAENPEFKERNDIRDKKVEENDNL